MFKVILIVIALFLSSVGIGELMHRLWMLFLRPSKLKTFLVLPLYDATAEDVTAALEEMRWYGKNYADMLVGVDFGLSDTEKKRCKEIESLTDNFLLANADEIEGIIKKGG